MKSCGVICAARQTGKKLNNVVFVPDRGADQFGVLAAVRIGDDVEVVTPVLIWRNTKRKGEKKKKRIQKCETDENANETKLKTKGKGKKSRRQLTIKWKGYEEEGGVR